MTTHAPDTTNFPRVIRRKIGQLSIFDIQGDLIGPWAVRAEHEIRLLVSNEKDHAVILNLRPLQMIDSLGVKVIFKSLAQAARSGILTGSLSVMEMVEAYPDKPEIPVFRNEEELIRQFGAELVSNEACGDENKRKHWRMQTALPLVFGCETAQGDRVEFRAIITNLSEGGLFAEYIDLDDAVKSQSFVNPYELRMLEMSVKLPEQQLILVKGKVVRRKLDGDQVGIGIEFYEIDQESKDKIREFLSPKSGAETP